MTFVIQRQEAVEMVRDQTFNGSQQQLCMLQESLRPINQSGNAALYQAKIKAYTFFLILWLWPSISESF